jgi:hypothetical protein
VIFAGLTIFAILKSRSSGTSTTPRLLLDALKAKLLVSALVFEIQLKMVVFPMFVIPMIPHLSAINPKFEGEFFCKDIVNIKNFGTFAAPILKDMLNKFRACQ